MVNISTSRGRCLPLGTTALAEGINFAVLCRHGTAVSLVLYSVDGDQPLAEIALDPSKNRTGSHWHVRVSGLPPVFRYGWREDVPNGPCHRFDPSIVLFDPPCTAVADGAVWVQARAPDPRRSRRRTLVFRRTFR